MRTWYDIGVEILCKIEDIVLLYDKAGVKVTQVTMSPKLLSDVTKVMYCKGGTWVSRLPKELAIPFKPVRQADGVRVETTNPCLSSIFSVVQ